MKKRRVPRQMIQVGNHQVALPEGVTVSDWALERVHWQNPRIRAFLGCIRLLEGVLESNYSLLHCSPERLLDIWSKVRRVAELIRTRIAPLLRGHSRVPALEEARQSAELSLNLLAAHVLDKLERFPAEVPPARLSEIRKLLCISIGQLHAFLQDTFGELMAKDPRSVHDSDYFLSRRFPQDIEEAEWLHATVSRLHEYVQKLDQVRPLHLTAQVDRMRADQAMPGPQAWEDTRLFVDVLLHGLTPKLKEVLALRGVRFQEMEILDRYAIEIPIQCRILFELQATGSEAEGAMQAAGDEDVDRRQSLRDLRGVRSAVSRHMADLMAALDAALRDLVAFLPLWLEGIERRRALLLKRGSEEAEAGPAAAAE